VAGLTGVGPGTLAGSLMQVVWKWLKEDVPVRRVSVRNGLVRHRTESLQNELGRVVVLPGPEDSYLHLPAGPCASSPSAAALVVFTLVLPLVRPGGLKANDVLYTVKDPGALNCCSSWSAASAALALNVHGDVAGLTSSPSDPQRSESAVLRKNLRSAMLSRR
jgi:hypothetical protein